MEETLYIGFLKSQEPPDAARSETPKLRQPVDGQRNDGEPTGHFVRREQISHPAPPELSGRHRIH